MDFNPTLANGNYSGISFYNGISIKEIAGREGNDSAGAGTATRTWLLRGSADPLVCRTALDDGPVLINTYDGYFIESLSRVRVADESWEFTATYNAAIPDVGGYTVSIDTSGGQVLQTYGYAQTKYNATGETGPDYGNALDVQDGKPQGVQRVIPALKINVRAKIATAYVSSPMAYSKVLANLTGTTNSGSMFDGEFAAGELLFVGATGEVVAKNPQLTFTFIASENVTGLTIGDITGIAKQGHEYLWFLFKDDIDATTKLKVSLPRAAYVGRVYGSADHSLMKIGVT